MIANIVQIVFQLMIIIGFIILLFVVLSYLYPENKFLNKILDLIPDSKDIREHRKALKKEQDFFKNATNDEKIEYHNKKEKTKNTRPYLLLTEKEVKEKYSFLDFDDKNIFIINQPNCCFSLETEKIVNSTELEYDEKTMIIKNKNCVNINVDTIKIDDIETYMSKLSYDYLFIYAQDKDPNTYRFKTLKR